jgi:Uma2 family endonuclease
MVAHPKPPTTVEQFERFIERPENVDRRFELIDGEIVEMSPSELHGVIAAIIAARLLIFVEEFGLGRVAVESRYQMPGDNENARLPDVSFTSKARALPIVERGSVPQMPDLAVEIRSHDDKLKQLREKAAYYLANGSRMVWLVRPEKHMVEVYRPDSVMQSFSEEQTLDGGDVLPGFKLLVRDIFPK